MENSERALAYPAHGAKMIIASVHAGIRKLTMCVALFRDFRFDGEY